MKSLMMSLSPEITRMPATTQCAGWFLVGWWVSSCSYSNASEVRDPSGKVGRNPAQIRHHVPRSRYSYSYVLRDGLVTSERARGAYVQEEGATYQPNRPTSQLLEIFTSLALYENCSSSTFVIGS